MLIVKTAKIKDKAILPQKKTNSSAGFDVYACLDEPIIIAPIQRKAIPTGITLEIPEGYQISVRPRSGLAIHHGITLPNAPGTIDSDYRGEVLILVINLGEKAYTIKHGDRIAQFIPEPVIEAHFKEYDLIAFSKTERGSGGFGSTGE